MTDYESGDHSMFSRLFGTGNKTVAIIAGVVLVAVVIVSVGYTIHKLTAPKRSKRLAVSDVRFQCMQCKKEFSLPYKEVRKPSSGQTRGLILDCRLCEAPGSALKMRQCPECEKYFVLQSARAKYEARKAGKQADLRGIREICSHCKADIFDSHHKRMMQEQEQGNHKTEVRDLSKTIELNAKSAEAYKILGNSHWRKGDFDAASRDFAKSIELKPADPYPHIFLFLTQARMGKDGKADLARFRKTQEDDKWITPVIRMYLGEITPTQCLAAAVNKDAKLDKEQKCEGYYYIGQFYLIRGKNRIAREYFEKCVATNVCNFCEYSMAKAELKRLAK